MFGQQRPQSGPSSLSINTGSANSLGTGGLFGSAQQKPAGGLFDSSTNTLQPKQSSIFGSTATSNAGGLFGSSTSTSQPQPTNLFGATTTNNTGGLFGSNTQNNQQQQGGGLFGMNNQQPQPGGGVFGTQPNQQQGGLFGSNPAAQPGGGLFGSTNTQSTQPAQGGGLFGSTNTQQSQPTQGGGLFGSTATQQSQPTLGGGLFGSTTTQQPQLPQGGGLFGSTNTQQPRPALGGGLFGSNTGQQAQPAQSGGLFGSIGQGNQTQQPQAGLFGGLGTQNKQSSIFNNTMPSQSAQNRAQPSTMGPPPVPAFSASIGQYTASQQTVPGVRISINELRPTTRFNDLHEDLQRTIEKIDNFILQQIQYQSDCETALDSVARASEGIPSDVEYCSTKLDTMQQALENDAQAIEYARKLVGSDVGDARLSFKAIRTLKMPQQFHYSGLWNTQSISQTATSSIPSSNPSYEDSEDGSSSNLVSYFSKQADEMSKTLDSYKRNISEVEGYLKDVETSTMMQMQQMLFSKGGKGERGAEQQVRELAGVLREFEHGILGVAGRVGVVREKVQDLVLLEGEGRRRV